MYKHVYYMYMSYINIKQSFEKEEMELREGIEHIYIREEMKFGKEGIKHMYHMIYHLN